MNIIDLYEKTENLYFVGGIVRDELLGKKSLDIDVTFEGNAIEFAKSIEGIEILQINEPFGTVKIKIEDKEIDLASTRSETYPNKGQLPVVEKIGCSLKEDVLRRDFTVNSIAKNTQNNEIIDYVNGIKDLKEKKLRILHDNSFVDDPTRIIRGLKFAVRFGFELEENTLKKQTEYLLNVDYNMSFKRLKDELVSAFNLNKQEVFDRFVNQKMYKLLSDKSFQLPKENIEKILEDYLEKTENAWLIYLCGFDLNKLELTKNEKRILEDYYQIKDKKLDTRIKIYEVFKDLQTESILMYGIFKDFEPAKIYLNELRYIKLESKGDDLIKLGFKADKGIGECLKALMREKIERPEITKEAELDIAKKFM